MTTILAGLLVIAYFVLVHLLRTGSLSRERAYILLGASPLISNIPVGYFYGWGGWAGTAQGFGITIATVTALALLQTRKGIWPRIPFLWLFALYAIPLILSIFAARMWLAATFSWWQFATMIPIFVAVAGEGGYRSIRSSILFGFSLGLTYQAMHSIYQKLSGITQAAGTFDHQNILGLATELSLLPLVAMVLSGQRSRMNYVGIAAGLVCVAGSGSRATMGIMGAVFALLVLLSLVRNMSPHKVSTAFAGVALLALATPFALATLNDRFRGETFMVEDTSRVQFEKVAKAIADDNLIGVGSNNYVFVTNTEGYADRFKIGWGLANRSVPVHNAYLLARAETGRLGELTFIAIFVFPIVIAFITAFRFRKSTGGDLLLGYASALLAVLLHNTYEFAIHTIYLQALLFIVLGLVAAEVRMAGLSPRQKSRVR